MHVDWRWVKQRPHAMALELAARNSVFVLYRVNPFRRCLVRENGQINRLPLLPMPVRLLGRVEYLLQRAYVSIVADLFRPNVIWVTFPDLVQYLPRTLSTIRVVYDCMDDAASFFADSQDKQRVKKQERRLVERSSLVLCSSRTLKERMEARYPHRKVFQLMHNAVDADFLSTTDVIRASPATGGKNFNAAYFGTVSHWLDYRAIREALDRVPNLRIHLYGPVESRPPLAHERLLLGGLVEHGELPALAQDFDVLLIPFARTRLVEAVDPVKLYEYLAIGREVVALRYPELERFAPYAHLCETPQEFAAILEGLSNGRITPRNERHRARSFLRENTWQRRAEDVQRKLEEMLDP